MLYFHWMSISSIIPQTLQVKPLCFVPLYQGSSFCGMRHSVDDSSLLFSAGAIPPNIPSTDSFSNTWLTKYWIVLFLLFQDLNYSICFRFLPRGIYPIIFNCLLFIYISFMPILKHWVHSFWTKLLLFFCLICKYLMFLIYFSSLFSFSKYKRLFKLNIFSPLFLFNECCFSHNPVFLWWQQE